MSEGERAEEARKRLVRLVSLVWSLGQWNDHNWTDDDYRRWREEAQELAKSASADLASLRHEMELLEMDAKHWRNLKTNLRT